MPSYPSVFKILDKSYVIKVRIGNGALLEAQGKCMMTISTLSSTKSISNVLLVPKIYQKLISVGQLLEKNYALEFENNGCTILNPNKDMIINVPIKAKSFPLKLK